MYNVSLIILTPEFYTLNDNIIVGALEAREVRRSDRVSTVC